MRKHKNIAIVRVIAKDIIKGIVNVSAKAIARVSAKGITIVALGILLTACQSKANFSVKAAHYLNPDINGKASPVLITVYQLKNGYTFEQADYDALMGNSASLLGSDLIDKNSFEIRPATHISVSENLYPDTHYIGIVAAYRSADIANWHRVIKVKNPGHSVSLNLSLEAQGLSVTVE